MWYDEVDTFLESIGRVQISQDLNLYLYQEDGNIVITLLFVDDLLISGTSQKLILRFKAELSTKYETKDLGPVKRYLGVTIS